jgi:putative hydrolase of the HAD superfamily
MTGVPEDAAIDLSSRTCPIPRLSTDAEKRIEAQFLLSIERIPALRKGVQEGLKQLKSGKCIVLVLTEGSRRAAVRAARHHHLDSIDRIMEVRKSRGMFERVLRVVSPCSAAFMIGDQLDRDIHPAKEAGLRTIFFPGGFRPRWQPDEVNLQPDFRIDDFAQVPGIVLTAFGQARVCS